MTGKLTTHDLGMLRGIVRQGEFDRGKRNDMYHLAVARLHELGGGVSVSPSVADDAVTAASIAAPVQLPPDEDSPVPAPKPDWV